MIGPVPVNATLPAERPEHVVGPGYMRLSGTSFAAPIVAGAAAQILARHPTWTPDQVKGALMPKARFIPDAPPGSAGVGELNAQRSADVRNPPNPNLALNRFVIADSSAQRQRDARLRRGELVGPGKAQRLLGLGLVERRLLVGRFLERRFLVATFPGATFPGQTFRGATCSQPRMSPRKTLPGATTRLRPTTTC